MTLNPGDYLLLVGDLDAFATKYDVPSGVQVFEWPKGKLDNAGEKIQLSMPGDVDIECRRQWIRVDRVKYSDGSHPDDTPGSGYSLSRINPADYGNDPINWKAAIPSPGLFNPKKYISMGNFNTSIANLCGQIKKSLSLSPII